MAYNKFIKKDGTVMLNLLEDTVTAETLQQGVTAHNRSGETVTGTLNPDASLNAYASELANIIGDGTQTPSDVEQELNYLLETANRATGVIESTLAETINNLVDGYGANGVVVGKRKFIESPAVPTTYITQQVNFTVIDNNKLTNYTQMGAGKVDNENRISYGSVIYTSTDGWQDENLKIIDFGETPQTVSGAFAQFIANNTEDIDERIVEVATETEMNELFPLAENGTVFKYVGETGTYENGALYVVEEEETTYSLTITNIGQHIYNEYIYYSVDSEDYGPLRIEANSTLKIDGIKNYVYCVAGTEFREESTVLNNCTIEWFGTSGCKIYPTGDNATATLESYD